jgi:hypothetical protein
MNVFTRVYVSLYACIHVCVCINMWMCRGDTRLTLSPSHRRLVCLIQMGALLMLAMRVDRVLLLTDNVHPFLAWQVNAPFCKAQNKNDFDCYFEVPQFFFLFQRSIVRRVLFVHIFGVCARLCCPVDMTARVQLYHGRCTNATGI